MALFFASQGIATLIAFSQPTKTRLRALTLPGAGVIVYVGLSALGTILRSAEMEGYVLLVAAALVVQGVLTLIAVFFSDSIASR